MLFRRFYKTIGLMVCAFTICMQTTAYAASDMNMINTPCMTSEDYEITPYADVIVFKTRIHNGKAQYRHWNETRGYWVEPDWIDM
mgnify:CR=1 FL=1